MNGYNNAEIGGKEVTLMGHMEVEVMREETQ